MQTVAAADYHDIATPADPRVSPDGERVAFVRHTPDDEETVDATVYVVSTRGGDPRRFTLREGEDSQPRWSPSGDRLAFVSTRGADDDRPQLWVLPTDGGEARQVTTVAGGVADIAWSPDGTRIAFTQQASAADREAERDLEVPEDFEPDEPDPRVIDRTVYRSMQDYFDGKRSHVYVVAVGGEAGHAGTAAGGGDDDGDGNGGDGDRVRRLTDGEADFTSPTWGDDGTLYYAERVGEDPDDSIAYDILAHDLATDETERLHRTTGWVASLAATADGRIAHVYQDEDRATLRPAELKVYDRSTGDVAHPTADLDRTLELDASPQWGPDETDLYFTTPDAGRVPVWRVPWDGTDAERVVADGHVDGVHVGADLLAYTQSEWDHPGDVFVATRGGGEVNRLTRLNSDYLDERAVAQPQEIRFDSENGTAPASADGEPADVAGDVQGWVLTPPAFGGPAREVGGDGDSEGGDGDGDEGAGDGEAEIEQYPLVVEVHGGPHAMWSPAGTMWHEFQTLAARGYVVFWSNPRGSTGYGEEFAAAIERDWGEVTMTDVMAGAREVADRDYVDEDQLFLTGGSFGGFMTSWMVGHTDAFEAAVTQRGVHDLLGFYGSTDQAYKLVEGDFDTTPWDDPAFLWEQSPAAYCDEVDTPTLVLHSDRDYRTPANTAELFHRGLRKHDVDTRLVRYPREGHELSRSGEPGHVVDRIERIARWFDGYSAYHDAPRALDRPENAGLSAGKDEYGDEDGDE